MPRYKVTIRRTSAKMLDFEVEADNEEEAHDRAMDDSCDEDFNLGRDGIDPEYDVVETTLLPPEEEEWEPKSHWDDHPKYAPSDWEMEVANNATRLSYIDWVNNELRLDND